MTAETKRKKAPGKRSPLTALKPVVVLATHEHAASVVLGVSKLGTDQRDAAIAYLNETVGSSFRLNETAEGQPYTLYGCTSAYTGSDEFREVVENLIRPKFLRTGTLKMEVVRRARQMVGVECVVTATSRGLTNLPELATDPAEVLGLIHEGSSVAFTLRGPNRKDGELIKDALRVAAAFGVYIERPPTQVSDADRHARLYREFDYVEPSASA